MQIVEGLFSLSFQIFNSQLFQCKIKFVAELFQEQRQNR